MTTLLGTPTRVGGLLVNGGFSGQLVVLGNDYGDLTFHGGLTGGRIAVKGTGGAQSGILGNVIIDRGFYPTGTHRTGSAIVSGGEIGDASLRDVPERRRRQPGDRRRLRCDQHRRRCARRQRLQGRCANPGNPNDVMDANAIDAIFTSGGLPLGLDDKNGEDLQGLAQILANLAALKVDTNTGNLTD